MANFNDYCRGHLDGKVTALRDLVIIRKLEKYHDELIGGVAVPLDVTRGFNRTKGIVESVGPDAKKDGIEVGMTVLYDHFSAHGVTHPLVCVNAENVICRCLD